MSPPHLRKVGMRVRCLFAHPNGPLPRRNNFAFEVALVLACHGRMAVSPEMTFRNTR